jgi:hypothetical protein
VNDLWEALGLVKEAFGSRVLLAEEVSVKRVRFRCCVSVASSEVMVNFSIP